MKKILRIDGLPKYYNIMITIHTVFLFNIILLRNEYVTKNYSMPIAAAGGWGFGGNAPNIRIVLHY
jgi:hypothetical protein